MSRPTLWRRFVVLLVLAIPFLPAAAVSPSAVADEAPKPDATKTAPSATDEAKPDANKPDANKPDATRPNEAKPEDAKPDKEKPEEAQPDQSKKDRAAAALAELEATDYELYRTFVDTLDQIERNYVKEVDRRQLVEAAIRGMLDELDPYSNYISPKDLSRFDSSVESRFGGIGIQIAIVEKQLTITSPIVGSPAYRAGVQAGDQIVKIEGNATKGIRLDDAVKKLKGEEGTEVTLTLRHPGGQARDITLKREIIEVDTVLGDTRNDDDTWNFMLDAQRRIGYIRITSFSRHTARDLRQALQNLKDARLGGLILDLRFNPGGLLSSAIEVSDLFVSQGRIVSTAGRNARERKWDAHTEGTFDGFPMVVLVNRYSASASEIVSACLQDHHRAVVMGERSFGKGSVQNVIRLEEGRSALKLTTAGYHRPSGKNIHKFPGAKDDDQWGVLPDKGYLLKLADEELSQLMAYRRERDIVLPHDKSADSQAKAEDQPNKDDQPEDAAGNKPDDTQSPSEDRPADEKPDDKQSKREKEVPSAAPPAEKPVEKPKDDKPESEPKSEPPTGKPSAGTEQKDQADPPAPFVDRQLQKAVDYLTTELAKAK